MTMTATSAKLILENELLKFTFLNSGDLYQASGQNIMINQLLSNPVDGSLGNIYLRLHEQDGIHAYPLLGVDSGSLLRKYAGHLEWEGEIKSLESGKIKYRVRFTLADEGIWFWDVELEGSGAEADLIYAQDVGIADPGAVRSNEAYLSQYIDHNVFDDEQLGYVICSRQNQPQGGKFPYLQQGSLTKAVGYSTDGFQFFGLSYKETNKPAILSREKLANDIYQYEFAYTALQTQRVRLNGQAQFNFYGLFRPDHPAATSSLEYTADVRKAWDKVQAQLQTEQGRDGGQTFGQVARCGHIGEPLKVLPIEQKELELLFPNRCQEEYDSGTLLSFFTDTYEHVILKDKELRVERPHGHILMSGDNARMNDQVITTTSYMFGVFNSQLVVGNTNFNKMMTNTRNALNVPKTSGQRIYVELEGKFHLLTMPSLFEIGFNYTRWYYKTASDMLVVTNYTVVDSPQVNLSVRSVSGKAYRYLVTNQISMNVGEYEVPYHMEQQGRTLLFRADQASISSGFYPALTYRLDLEGAGFSLTDERSLVSGPAQGTASLVVLELEPAAEWTMTIQGLIQGVGSKPELRNFDSEVERYREFYARVMNGFKLSRGGEQGELFKVNALAWWYTHNMLVHYSVPHGLEQYGGAAWGTRDVCQGPAEYFMATHNYKQVRDIILTVYSHQYKDDGNWPQWFMFDKYAQIQQEDSHGDIIVWPLKVLSDYLTATKDFGILQELVPYTRKHSFDFTEPQPLRDHVLKELGYIEGHFLHDTCLSSYGDGDWDDTLQPANEQLKQYMVSSWTVALTYQAIRQLSQVLQETEPQMAEDLEQLYEGIRRDFNQYMLGTGVIPGFVYLENPDDAKLMVHPTDQETGIQYRLLPMTRSMISELLTPEQAESHYKLIQEHLLCPDGVRLMNRPAQYTGGVSIHFKRAEQAANFGREIGLQYVHAHIRYVEAMAKLGKRDQVWHGLAAINPIGIQDVVPNAELRQSNTYFSSSDGKFATRYEAQTRFEELKHGKVPVKGGWRIYSSGPGIYMNQLISAALGIREAGGDLVIDPVLPADLDGLHFDFEYDGQPVTFIYRYTDGVVRRVAAGGQDVPATATANRYRSGGLRIRREDLRPLLAPSGTEIEIYM
ncbi:hypothetical protein J22TS3_22550 [Paenibacillus sp. J22TS3]|nr:hypothetical protein J22TS3_22550 [Paenibacillus sp. J22TS3]